MTTALPKSCDEPIAVMHFGCRVYLEGKLVSYVSGVDTGKGYVDHYELGQDGRVIIDPSSGRPFATRSFGRVRVVYKEAWLTEYPEEIDVEEPA